MTITQKVIFWFFIFLAAWMWFLTDQASAQSPDQFGRACRDGQEIVQCQTFNCPFGDTNGDGNCNLSDRGAELQSARKDGLCANPASGCGEIHYFPAGTSGACGVRVKENSQETCDLYNAADPQFAPVSAPSSSAKNLFTPVPDPAQDVTKGGEPVETLPETGAEIFLGLGALVAVVVGKHLYESSEA